MNTQGSTTERQTAVGAHSALTRRALERISVAQPYFALTDIEGSGEGDSVTASVPPGRPAAPEVGAIAAAQVARHLAILGSCAAALRNDSDQRHHYLAVGATYERLGSPIDVAIDEPMRATATATWQDKRTATATMVLSGANGEPLNRLDVTYAVMKPKMFGRLNPRVEMTAGAITEPGGPIVVEQSRGSVVTDYGLVPVELCAGHFPDHPVAPIALVMGRLVRTTRDALCSHLGTDVAYRVEAGTVEASGLAQPGQRLTLEASHVTDNDDGTHRLHGRALADDVQIGAVQVTLAAVTE